MPLQLVCLPLHLCQNALHVRAWQRDQHHLQSSSPREHPHSQRLRPFEHNLQPEACRLLATACVSALAAKTNQHKLLIWPADLNCIL